ncbi:MAG: hypothetical protein QNK36_21560 [Colwellia sp.]|nr:hypothetical protein [Colwellia sp.]
MTKIKTLTKSAAIKLQNMMFQSSKDIQIHIEEFVERNGYKALGYDSLKEWCNDNKSSLGMSYDTINNHFHAARISLLMGEEAGTFFTYSILPMKNLSQKDIKKVVKQAKKHHGVDELTDEHFTTLLTEKFMEKIGLKESTKKTNDDPSASDEDASNDDYSASDEDGSNDDEWNESDGSDATSDEDDKPDGSDEELFDLTTLQVDLIEELNTIGGSSETRQLGKAIMKVFSIKRQLRLCKTILKASKNEQLEELADELSDFIKDL